MPSGYVCEEASNFSLGCTLIKNLWAYGCYIFYIQFTIFFVISEHEKSTPANYKLNLSLCFEILKIFFFIIFNLFCFIFQFKDLKVKCIYQSLTEFDFRKKPCGQLAPKIEFLAKVLQWNAHFSYIQCTLKSLASLQFLLLKFCCTFRAVLVMRWHQMRPAQTASAPNQTLEGMYTANDWKVRKVYWIYCSIICWLVVYENSHSGCLPE